MILSKKLVKTIFSQKLRRMIFIKVKPGEEELEHLVVLLLLLEVQLLQLGADGGGGGGGWGRRRWQWCVWG